MRSFHFLPALITCILISACSSTKNVSFPTQVISLPGAEEGTVVIRSSGHGTTESEAVRSAEKQAFNRLLFYGLPSSSQVRPMVENETQSKKEHSRFYDSFFEKNSYKDYIITSFNYGSISKSNKYYYLNRDIKINLRSLRVNLENNGIIRKFGY